MLDIGSETANARDDWFPVLRVFSDFAGEREQGQCAIKIDVLRRRALRQTRALGILTVGRFSELDIGPETAVAHRHFESGCAIFAELLHSAIAIRTIARCERTRIAALRIIRATDKAAELAELER